MINFDFSDIYIRYPEHPSYNSEQIVEDEILRVIVQKYEMVLFTNKGEVLGEPNMGADLDRLLHKTRVSGRYVERIVNEQITEFIPELTGINYELSVSFEQNPNNFSDIMFINFRIKEIEVNAFFQ